MEWIGVGVVVVALTAGVAGFVPGMSGSVTDAVSALVCRAGGGATGQGCPAPTGDGEGEVAGQARLLPPDVGEPGGGGEEGAPRRSPEDRERERANSTISVPDGSIDEALDVIQDPVTQQMVGDYADLRAEGLDAHDAFEELRDRWEILENWHLNPNYDDAGDRWSHEQVLGIFVVSDSVDAPAPGTKGWEDWIERYQANEPGLPRDRIEVVAQNIYLDAVRERWRDLVLQDRGDFDDLVDILIQEGYPG